MKVQLKSDVKFDAIEFTKEMALDETQLPANVTFSGRSVTQERIDENGKTIPEVLNGHHHYMDTAAGKVQVDIGDYLVYGSDGSRDVFAPEEFKKVFEPTNPAAAKNIEKKKEND